ILAVGMGIVTIGRGIDLSAVAIMAMSVPWYLQMINSGTSDIQALVTERAKMRRTSVTERAKMRRTSGMGAFCKPSRKGPFVAPLCRADASMPPESAKCRRVAVSAYGEAHPPLRLSRRIE